jgi:hypothetical protein
MRDIFDGRVGGCRVGNGRRGDTALASARRGGQGVFVNSIAAMARLFWRGLALLLGLILIEYQASSRLGPRQNPLRPRSKAN